MTVVLKEEDLIKNGKRYDGRGFEDLREIKIKAGVFKQARGSAFVEWGKNKVFAAVYGPHEVFPKHLTNNYKALINARYIMTPFSGLEDHGRSGPNRRSIEISKVVKHVFENVVLTNLFPKTMIDVHMEVVQSDGGTRIASLTAASVALADAGIPMRDLVAGVSVGKVAGELVLDLDKYEDNLGSSDIPMVFAPRNGEILLYQMDGLLSKEELERAFDLGWKASKKIRELQEKALKEKYQAVFEEIESSPNDEKTGE